MNTINKGEKLSASHELVQTIGTLSPTCICTRKNCQPDNKRNYYCRICLERHLYVCDESNYEEWQDLRDHLFRGWIICCRNCEEKLGPINCGIDHEKLEDLIETARGKLGLKQQADDVR